MPPDAPADRARTAEGPTSNAPASAPAASTGPFGPRSPLVLALVAFGLVMRVVLVAGSPGTLDVTVWEGHAKEIARLGLVEYYGGGAFIFNHPPLSGWLVARLHDAAAATGTPFAAWLRAPFAMLDGATALLLVALAGHASSERLRARRHLLGAVYWASPLAIVFSAHHGNTDAAVACSLVGAVLAFARGRWVWAGIALGLGAWIKIPGLLAAPALFFALPDHRARLRFTAAVAATTLAGFAPALVQDFSGTVNAVFGYSGLRIQTTAGIPVFGPQVFYPEPASLPQSLRGAFVSTANAYYRADGVVMVLLVTAYGALRRRHGTPEGLAFTVAHGYAAIYAFSNFFAFQYLAWSLPLWLIAGWPLAVAAHLLGTAYVWGLYAWLCEHVLLLDTWRFVAKPVWPTWLRVLRDLCVAFFMGLTVARFAQAIRETISRRPRPETDA